MSKITLTTVGDISLNPTTAATVINNNSSIVQTAMDNTLSRDGTSPNQMTAPIDMNSNRIVNLPGPVGLTEPVRLTDLGAFTGNITINALPVGGTTGQALTKKSNTNYDTQWSSSAGTVTSVALTLPADFTVTGSPITSNGTIAATFVSSPTGTGGFVRQTTPTLITPVLGVATATTINKMQIQAPATSSSIAIADGKGFTVNNGLTLAGTDGTTITFQATDTYIGRATTDTFTNKTFDTAGSGNVLKIAGTSISGINGSGSVLLANTPTITSPTLVTPALGVATATTLAVGGVSLSGATFGTAGSAFVQGIFDVVSNNAFSFGVGPNGGSNPAFNVDASTASMVAGLNVKGAVTGGSVLLSAIDTGSNTTLSLLGKGTSPVQVNPYLLIGPIAAPNQAALLINATVGGGLNDCCGIQNSPNFAAGNADDLAGIFTVSSLAAGSAYTVANMFGIRIENVFKGTGSSVTNVYGLKVDQLTAGSVTNQAIWTQGSSTVGFGTALAQAPLHINQNTVQNIAPQADTMLHLTQTDGHNTWINLDTYQNGLFKIPGVNFRCARGTAASPTAVGNGDFLGLFGGFGYTGSGAFSNSLSAGFAFVATENFVDNTHQGTRMDFIATPNASAPNVIAMSVFGSKSLSVGNSVDPGAGSITATGGIKSSSSSAGIGYTVGAGSSSTAQTTNRTTAVTSNTPTGTITLFGQVNTAISGATAQSFVVNCSSMAATDTVLINQKSGTDKYLIFITLTGAGFFQVTNYTTGGTTNESPVFNYTIIKGSIT